MIEVYEFLRKCGTYFLATVEDDQPRVRPFGTIDIFGDRLYIETGKIKKVSKQMNANPKIEICAYDGERWIRIQAVVESDERIEAKQHMLETYPSLKGMYKAEDDNMQVLFLKDATATICSITGETKTICF